MLRKTIRQQLIDPTLIKLNLPYHALSPDEIIAIAGSLANNNSLTSLNLLGNKINENGVRALADAFKVNESLIHVNLSYCEISKKGADYLADALTVNQSLSVLNLASNNIGIEGANALADALKINNSLTLLDLVKNGIGDEGTSALANALKINNSLTSLDLVHNNIGNEGACALAEALKINKSLTSLVAWGNAIGSTGACALAEALKVNESLTSLNLLGNKISDRGLDAFVDAFKCNMILTLLDLKRNKVGDKISELVPYLDRNKNFFVEKRYKTTKIALPFDPESSENYEIPNRNSQWSAKDSLDSFLEAPVDIGSQFNDSTSIRNKKRKNTASYISDAPPLKRPKLDYALNPLPLPLPLPLEIELVHEIFNHNEFSLKNAEEGKPKSLQSSLALTGRMFGHTREFEDERIKTKLSKYIAEGRLEMVDSLLTIRPDLSCHALFALAGFACQDKMKMILEKDLDLFKVCAPIKDISGVHPVINDESKKGITVFQHAIWAEDGHNMCNMMLDCLPNNEKGEEIRVELARQCAELMEKGVVYYDLNGNIHHKLQFSLQPLLQRLQNPIQNLEKDQEARYAIF